MDNLTLDNTIDFSCHTTLKANGYHQFHCHNYFEIYGFISGDAVYMVEGKHYKLSPGSVLIIRPNIVHGISIKGDNPYKRYAFHFMKEYVSKEYQDILLAPFYGDSILYESSSLLSFFDWILKADNLPASIQRIARQTRFEAFLSELLSLKSYTIPEGRPEYLELILSYINLHMTEPLSINQICAQFYISKSQLTRCFRFYLNTTVWNYIVIKRINIAKQLIYEGKSVETAAYLAGFMNYSTFYRSYVKITGHSPSKEKAALSHCPFSSTYHKSCP